MKLTSSVRIKRMDLFTMRMVLTFLIFLSPLFCFSQTNAPIEKKIFFQGYLSGNLLQTALNLEFVKAQCKSQLSAEFPAVKIDYEVNAYQTIKKYAIDSAVLDVTKQMRDRASKNANFEALLIPGLQGKEWCLASVHEHVTLFNSISSILRKSAEI